MNEIICPQCGKPIELTEALTKDIEKNFLEIEHKKHVAEIEKIKEEADEKAQKQIEEERVKAQTVASTKVGLKLKQLQDDSDEEKKENKELREQILELTTGLRASRKIAENAEISMQKKLDEESVKIKEEAEKSADEKHHLKLAEKDKQLEAARKANDELQRKLNQGSQQLQGEILELDLEESLANAFRDDKIVPIAKGVNGADVKQIVCSQSSIECGTILWELKRTKAWTESWIDKLKTDLRNAKANIPVIVTEVLPKTVTSDMGLYSGVWVCKPNLAIVLASLLRKSLLDVAREKVIAQNKETNAEALYNFVTSHEFIQQIESMIETYQEMTQQVTKERVVYEKLWALREKQANKLLMSTANIVGSMQGQIGTGSMPKIKGLEIDLLGPGDGTNE